MPKFRQSESATGRAPLTARLLVVVLQDGVAVFDAADALPVPTKLVAVTVKVYEAPFVKPVTVALVPDVLTVVHEGEQLTV